MNKQQYPNRNENNSRIEKEFPGRNINEEQVSQNNSKEIDQPSIEQDHNAKVMPMHEEDTLGNP